MHARSSHPGMFGLLAAGLCADRPRPCLGGARRPIARWASLDDQGASVHGVGTGRCGDVRRPVCGCASACSTAGRSRRYRVARTPTGRPTNSSRWLTWNRFAGRRPMPWRLPRRRWPTVRPSRSSFLAARVFRPSWRDGQSHSRSPRELASDLQAASQAYVQEPRRPLGPETAMRRLGPFRRLERGQPPPRYLVRPLRSGTGVSRGRSAFLQADSAFERCLKRRGEALSLFLDDEPTYGYFPPVYYYQGRVREGLNSTRAGESVQDLSRHPREDPQRTRSYPRFAGGPAARGIDAHP